MHVFVFFGRGSLGQDMDNKLHMENNFQSASW